VELMVGSKSALALAKEPIFHERSKQVPLYQELLGRGEHQGRLHQHSGPARWPSHQVPWAGQVPEASRLNWDGSNSPEGATQDLGGGGLIAISLVLIYLGSLYGVVGGCCVSTLSFSIYFSISKIWCNPFLRTKQATLYVSTTCD